MSEPMKMSFVDKLKSVFKSKPAPYKTYTPSQLRVTAMRARIYLQQHFKKCIQMIQAEDSVLWQRKQSPGDCYRILQEIGKHVIEVESIKIYVEILRKIEDRSASIIKTNGDIALLRTQLNWFQCLLWYRKCRKIIGLDELNTLSFNFFKGVDVTCEITPKCQIFQICPIMLYLDPKCIIPIKKIYPEITTYITTKLDYEFLNQLFKVNKMDIKRWMNQEKIQYREKYISKSKSPVKIQNISPPKRYNNEMDFSKKQSIGNQSRYNQPSDNFNIANNNPHPENDITSSKSNLQHKTSFMRKLMDSSKIKTKNICAQCGVDMEIDRMLDGQNSQEEVPSFSKVCDTCQKNRKLQQQKQRKLKEEQQVVITCRVCHKKMSNPADLSFNGTTGNKSFSFSEEICQECLQNQQKQKRDLEINDNSFNLINEQHQGIQNKKQEILPSLDIQQKKPFDQQMRIPEIEPAKEMPAQNHAEVEQQQYDDEEESLRFIRQHIVIKKKPVKKPYMVSIYARAQYVNQSFKK